ncbi:ubiquitin-conjugating enzyme E2 [Thermodesulfobacteriota bacterium]
MSPRIRRLNADYNYISTVYRDHPYVKLIETEGVPPEKYTFEFNVKGLVPEKQGAGYSVSNLHRAEIFLPREYPRRPPFCRMVTPVFHPNIDPQKICIGDHWSAGESLAHLIIRICEMICYQSYNIKSPLNGRAAAWAEKELEQLPLLKNDLRVGL